METWACAEDQASLSCPVGFSGTLRAMLVFRAAQRNHQPALQLDRLPPCPGSSDVLQRGSKPLPLRGMMAAGRQSAWDRQHKLQASPRHPALSLASRDTAQLHPKVPAKPSLYTLVSGKKTKSQHINSYLVHTIWTYQNALLH